MRGRYNCEEEEALGAAVVGRRGVASFIHSLSLLACVVSIAAKQRVEKRKKWLLREVVLLLVCNSPKGNSMHHNARQVIIIWYVIMQDTF